jgi:hypothetical protein
MGGQCGVQALKHFYPCGQGFFGLFLNKFFK